MNLIMRLLSGKKILITFSFYFLKYLISCYTLLQRKCDGVVLAVKKRKDSLRTVQKVIVDIKEKNKCELIGIILYS